VEVVISIFIGGLIMVLTAVYVEYLRTPRLCLAIEQPPCDLPYPDGKHPAVNARYLRLKLSNEPLPLIARWMQRSAALQCRREITFHHLDGQDVFGRGMAIRWANSPQPIANQILDLEGNLRFQILDFVRAATASRVDVYPGEEQLLDVAARFDDEPDCCLMNVQPNILFIVHEGAPFVGDDANDHNLLPKGRPFIMRSQQLASAILLLASRKSFSQSASAHTSLPRRLQRVGGSQLTNVSNGKVVSFAFNCEDEVVNDSS
jgi:hypothetical protein